jgi:(4S)-4-hydroxy-5-phosphonooxypentane-2,3-dione isomerase
MKQPTFAIVVVFKIKPDHIGAFTARVQQQAKNSLRLEEGCKQFDVLLDESDPNTIVLYETYVDAQAFAEHRQTPHFADFNTNVTPWVESKEVRRLTLLEELKS